MQPGAHSTRQIHSERETTVSHNVHVEPEPMSTKQAVAAGTSIGAAVIMATIGVLQFFEGIAAVGEDEVIVQGQEDTFKFALTTRGWSRV
ncbi:MAG: hypothetical protein LOY04_13925, partial [Rhodococcus ruber]|nr:hypothetical protein [Rhodococcus ruber]